MLRSLEANASQARDLMDQLTTICEAKGITKNCLDKILIEFLLDYIKPDFTITSFPMEFIVSSIRAEGDRFHGLRLYFQVKDSPNFANNYASYLQKQLPQLVIDEDYSSYHVTKDFLNLEGTAFINHLLEPFKNYLNEHPEVVAHYACESINGDIIQTKLNDLFGSQGINAYSSDFLSEIIIHMINEDHPNLSHASQFIVDQNESAPITIRNLSHTTYWHTYQLSGKAKEPAFKQKMIEFFNKLYPNAVRKVSEDTIDVANIALLNPNFLAAVQQKANSVSHDKIEFYRTRSHGKLTLTTKNCLAIINDCQDFIQHYKYTNDDISIKLSTLQTLLQRLSVHINTIPADSKDTNHQQSLLGLIQQIRDEMDAVFQLECVNKLTQVINEINIKTNKTNDDRKILHSIIELKDILVSTKPTTKLQLNVNQRTLLKLCYKAKNADEAISKLRKLNKLEDVMNNINKHHQLELLERDKAKENSISEKNNIDEKDVLSGISVLSPAQQKQIHDLYAQFSAFPQAILPIKNLLLNNYYQDLDTILENQLKDKIKKNDECILQVLCNLLISLSEIGSDYYSNKPSWYNKTLLKSIYSKLLNDDPLYQITDDKLKLLEKIDETNIEENDLLELRKTILASKDEFQKYSSMRCLTLTRPSFFDKPVIFEKLPEVCDNLKIMAKQTYGVTFESQAGKLHGMGSKK